MTIICGLLALSLLLIPHPPRGIAAIPVIASVLGMIVLPMGAALLLSALLTLAAARRTSKILSEFRSGQYLARWSFSPPFWPAFIQGEERRLRKIAWQFLIVILGCGLLVMIIAACAMPGTVYEKSLAALSVAVATFLLSLIVFSAIVSYTRNRCRRLADCGEAVIGTNAAYMAGDLAFWGYGIRALRGVRFLPGNPGRIEFFIGLNHGAKSVMRVVDLMSLVLLNPSNSAQTTQMLTIPVPKEQEAAAQALFSKLAALIPQRAHPSPAPASTPSASGPHPAAESEESLPLETLHRRARRWWRITFGIGFLGIALFVAAVIDNAIPGAAAKPLADALAVGGFFTFVVALLVLPIALYKSARFWRNARHLHRLHPQNLLPHD